MSLHQIPMICVPFKHTTTVDWKLPLKRYIADVYQEDPTLYENETSTINRLRQDIQGAGKDMTGRDLLYRYFGQLELLDLRFLVDEKHVKIPFTWNDAFTGHPTTQYSLAFEKASVLFNFAATLSHIAVAQNRADAQGQKRAYHFFRAAAGIFQYINDNFLHAPSLDLSREIIQLLSDLMLAQAHECFLKNSLHDRVKDRLIAKLASHASWAFGKLANDMKDHMDHMNHKGHRAGEKSSWLLVCEVKEKYYKSIAEQYQAAAHSAEAKYGEQVARLQIAKEESEKAVRLADQLSSAGANRDTLRSEAAPQLQDLCKSTAARCAEKYAAAERDNNMIYHDHKAKDDIPVPVERQKVAEAMKMTEIYTQEEAHRVVGSDIFARLVPLEVHESASRYSELKANMIREMTEKCDNAKAELRSSLDYMKLPEALEAFKQSVDRFAEPPSHIRSIADCIASEESKANSSLAEREARLQAQKERSNAMLRDIELTLAQESKEGDAMATQFGTQWTMEPLGFGAAGFRQDVRNHYQTLEKADRSDKDALHLYATITKEVAILREGGQSATLEAHFAEVVSRALEQSTAKNTKEKSLLESEVTGQKELESKLEWVNQLLEESASLEKETKAVLDEIKDRCQIDDISHLLVLNKKDESVEQHIFSSEMKKYQPLRQHMDTILGQQQHAIQKLTAAFKTLMEDKEAQARRSKWDLADTHHRRAVERLTLAGEKYATVQKGLREGGEFYTNLCSTIEPLRGSVKKFTSERARERMVMAKRIESTTMEADYAMPKKTIDPTPTASPGTVDTSMDQLERTTRQLSLQEPSQSPAQSPAHELMYSTSSYSQAQPPIPSQEPIYPTRPAHTATFTQAPPHYTVPPQRHPEKPQPPPQQQHYQQQEQQQQQQQQHQPFSLASGQSPHLPPFQQSLYQQAPSQQLPHQHQSSQQSSFQQPSLQQFSHQQSQQQQTPYQPQPYQLSSFQQQPYQSPQQGPQQPYHHQPSLPQYSQGQQQIRQQIPLPKPKEYAVHQQGTPPTLSPTGHYTPTTTAPHLQQASLASFESYAPSPPRMPMQPQPTPLSTPSPGIPSMVSTVTGVDGAATPRGPPVLQHPPSGQRPPPLPPQPAGYPHAVQYHVPRPGSMVAHADSRPGQYYPPQPQPYPSPSNAMPHPSHWQPPTVDATRYPPSSTTSMNTANTTYAAHTNTSLLD